MLQAEPRKLHGICESLTLGKTTEDINHGIWSAKGRRKANKEDFMIEIYQSLQFIGDCQWLVAQEETLNIRKDKLVWRRKRLESMHKRV